MNLQGGENFRLVLRRPLINTCKLIHVHDGRYMSTTLDTTSTRILEFYGRLGSQGLVRDSESLEQCRAHTHTLTHSRYNITCTRTRPSKQPPQQAQDLDLSFLRITWQHNL
jgi:hypothetical protein